MELLKIDELLTKFLDKECSDEERKEVIKWIQENPENNKFFNAFRETWLIAKYHDESFIPDTNAAWKKVHDRIRKKSVIIKTNKIYYRAAALFFLAVSLYMFYYFFPFTNQSNVIELANQSDSLQTIGLPDGSKVWLSKGSNLGYTNNFEESERAVNLNGEAFFEVTKNPDKPFVVTGSKTIVKVLGTSFIYRTYNNESEDKLIVNTGVVSFSERENRINKLTVESGYIANFYKATRVMEKAEKDNKSYFAQKTGRLIFENERFENIISTVSKYYNRNYYIGDNKLKELRITIAFNNQPVEEAIKLLEAVMDRKITDSAMTIVVY